MHLIKWRPRSHSSIFKINFIFNVRYIHKEQLRIHYSMSIVHHFVFICAFAYFIKKKQNKNLTRPYISVAMWSYFFCHPFLYIFREHIFARNFSYFLCSFALFSRPLFGVTNWYYLWSNEVNSKWARRHIIFIVR